MKKVKSTLMAALAATALLSGCSGLSRHEKEFIGNYFISELSDIDPLYELRGDGTSVMRAIRPEVATCWVEGRWHIVGDSLVIVNDPATLQVEGNRSVVGNVAPRVAYLIRSYDGVALTLDKDGVDYTYHRRPIDPAAD